MPSIANQDKEWPASLYQFPDSNHTQQQVFKSKAMSNTNMEFHELTTEVAFILFVCVMELLYQLLSTLMYYFIPLVHYLQIVKSKTKYTCNHEHLVEMKDVILKL